MSEVRTLILGTAGHVDHGKTALVRALTGTDTDRLEEEHRRGISIELGFAHLDLAEDLRLGIVDVPGHERFVRQMVAGAGGMDLAMLLVAADEGVMPQTREHLDVLRLLGVRTGLLVVTKIDLAEPDLREVVEEELRDLVAGSFLENAPMVGVSSVSGEGLDELRATLLEVARRCPLRRRAGDFRLPIDRIFVLPGAGVIVTGTAWEGVVRNGDSLRLLPQDRELRVREVQSHGRVVEEAGAGERVALALHGVKKEELARGDQLVGGTAWKPSALVGLRITAVDDRSLAGWVKQRGRFHIHHAAREVLGRLDLLDAEGVLAPGGTALARLICEEPLIARPGDRLVLRSYSPMLTVAGGVVLDPQPEAGWRRAHSLRWLEELDRGVSEDWPFAVLARRELAGLRRMELLALLGMVGFDRPDAEKRIEEREDAGQIVVLGDLVLDAQRLEPAVERAVARLREHQEAKPLSSGLPKEELRQAVGFEGSAALFGQLLARWSTSHALFVRGDRVRVDSAEPELSIDQREALVGLEERIRAARPLYEARDEELHDPALRLLLDSGNVVRLATRLFAHREQLEELQAKVVAHFTKSETLSVADVKEWTGASRKFVVPLLEWLDSVEVTRFDGKERRRGPRGGG